MASERSTGIEKIDIKAAEKVMSLFKKIMKNDKPLDLIISALDGMKEILGCQKITVYPIDFYIGKMTT